LCVQVSIKQEKIERAKTYRRVIEEAKQLGDFIRLADYMLVEGLVDRTISTTEELLSLLEFPRTGSDKTSKGVFLTTVSFSETSLEFTPNEGEVLQVVDGNVLEGVISVVQAAPRLLFMRSFGQHFEEKLTGLNPVSIVRETDRFLELRAKINGVIRQDFAEANQYVQVCRLMLLSLTDRLKSSQESD
jgi:dynein heavy chain